MQDPDIFEELSTAFSNPLDKLNHQVELHLGLNFQHYLNYSFILLARNLHYEPSNNPAVVDFE